MKLPLSLDSLGFAFFDKQRFQTAVQWSVTVKFTANPLLGWLALAYCGLQKGKRSIHKDLLLASKNRRNDHSKKAVLMYIQAPDYCFKTLNCEPIPDHWGLDLCSRSPLRYHSLDFDFN